MKLVGQQTRIDLTVSVEPGKVLEAWRGVEGVKLVTVEEEQISVLVEDSNQVLPSLFEAATRSSAAQIPSDFRSSSDSSAPHNTPARSGSPGRLTERLR